MSDDPTPQTLCFGPAPGVPNNPHLPVLIYPDAMSGEADAICRRIERNGWRGIWVWTVFDFHHYHPDAHEVLIVASGEARVLLGGETGTALTLHRGDAVVLPAGTGHKRLSQSPDFRICGAYPPGQTEFRTLRPDDPAPEAAGWIAATPLPAADPVTGGRGPLLDLWA